MGRPKKNAPIDNGNDRMSLVLTGENMAFVRVMSGLAGQSMNAFVNACLDHERERMQDTYNKVQTLIGEVRGANKEGD